MKKRKFWSKADAALLAVILLIALVFWLWTDHSESAVSAQIYLDGRLIQTVSLEEDAVFSPEGIPQITIQVQNRRIRFLSSDCPDQTCVQTGFLSAPGQYAVCLPHRLMIRIPASDDTPDAIT